MKNMKWSAIVVAAVLILSLFPGCSSSESSSGASSSSSDLSVTDSGPDSSTGTDIPEISGSDVPSPAEQSTPIDLTPSGSGASSDVDKKAKFEEAFNKNPIDQAYNTEAGAATTNAEMISVISKFSDIWEAEVSIADKKAKKALKGDALTKHTQAQKEWESSKDSQLDMIREAVQSAVGGSGVSQELGALTSNFYRTRVYAIYLYVYEVTGALPELTYNAANG